MFSWSWQNRATEPSTSVQYRSTDKRWCNKLRVCNRQRLFSPTCVFLLLCSTAFFTEAASRNAQSVSVTGHTSFPCLSILWQSFAKHRHTLCQKERTTKAAYSEILNPSAVQDPQLSAVQPIPGFKKLRFESNRPRGTVDRPSAHVIDKRLGSFRKQIARINPGANLKRPARTGR